MRISDWSSDVCSSDLLGAASPLISLSIFLIRVSPLNHLNKRPHNPIDSLFGILQPKKRHRKLNESCILGCQNCGGNPFPDRSEEPTSELQSLMRISYAVFCLEKQKTQKNQNTT